MGGNVESCLQALDKVHEPGAAELHILERINMNFSVHNAIINTSTLTRFKIAGELPELQVNFSDRKYSELADTGMCVSGRG
jgi:vacuolar protein sorting-associated protein 13A/C